MDLQSAETTHGDISLLTHSGTLFPFRLQNYGIDMRLKNYYSEIVHALRVF